MPELSSHASVRELFASGKFCYGAEVVTTRGFTPPEDPNQLKGFADALLADRRIGYVSITDSPGGAPMIPPDWLAGLMTEQRRRIVLHLTCKDMNRNGLESTAWRYASMGFENVLALTGDLPTTGFGGAARGVFDLDSLGLLRLLRSMNEGLVIPGRRGEPQKLPATDFFLGCAVSPFKFHERELMPQYFKLLRKIKAGAQWVVPQLGYDMRKFNEIKLLLAARGMEVPVVGNVYLLNKTVARMFNSGKLAGCVVSDSLMADMEKYSAGDDKGRSFFRQLAAKQLAVFKGLGFAAGYLGGIAKAETFGEIIDLAESYGPDDWREFLKEIRYDRPGEFFLFDHDPQTGLGDPSRINPNYLESLKNPRRSKEVTLGYRVSRTVHDIAFTRGKGLWNVMHGVYSRLDNSKLMSGMAHWLEHQAKQLGYGCQDCGDCSLPDCAYLCPLASCSKGSRNGPCGGSCDGRCEAEDKDCFWARIYDRLKYYGESESMTEMPIIYYNADLEHTSSWANTYLDRDHSAPGKESKSDGPSE
ncbi:MAG: methylenetetrahydrofolate reductase C-terminal domain-containing protein [Thermoguttaceae bacterium]